MLGEGSSGIRPSLSVEEANKLTKQTLARYKNTYLDGMFESYRRKKKIATAKRFKQEVLREIHLCYVDDVNEGIQAKHAIIDEIREKLAEWDTRETYRSPKQIELHEIFISTCACIVYGDRYFTDEYMDEILQHNNWTREQVFFLFSSTMPRRFGKTWCIAMWVIVLIICVPNVEVSIFAPTEKQSTMLLHFIRDKLRKKFPGWAEVKDSAREFWISKDETDVRKVHAWPKGVKVSKKKRRDTHSFFYVQQQFYHYLSINRPNSTQMVSPPPLLLRAW